MDVCSKIILVYHLWQKCFNWVFFREIKFSYILAYQILGKKKELILCASTNA